MLHTSLCLPGPAAGCLTLFSRVQDAEAGEAGGGTVTLPWSSEEAGDVGFIVSVPGEVQ